MHTFCVKKWIVTIMINVNDPRLENISRDIYNVWRIHISTAKHNGIASIKKIVESI